MMKKCPKPPTRYKMSMGTTWNHHPEINPGSAAPSASRGTRSKAHGPGMTGRDGSLAEKCFFYKRNNV